MCYAIKISFTCVIFDLITLQISLQVMRKNSTFLHLLIVHSYQYGNIWMQDVFSLHTCLLSFKKKCWRRKAWCRWKLGVWLDHWTKWNAPHHRAPLWDVTFIETKGDREQVKKIFQRFLPITLNIPSISKLELVRRREEKRWWNKNVSDIHLKIAKSTEFT
jgi:hypothetical protein